MFGKKTGLAGTAPGVGGDGGHMFPGRWRCGWLGSGPSCLPCPRSEQMSKMLPSLGDFYLQSSGPYGTESCDVGSLRFSLFFQANTAVGPKRRQERRGAGACHTVDPRPLEGLQVLRWVLCPPCAWQLRHLQGMFPSPVRFIIVPRLRRSHLGWKCCRAGCSPSSINASRVSRSQAWEPLRGPRDLPSLSSAEKGNRGSTHSPLRTYLSSIPFWTCQLAASRRGCLRDWPLLESEWTNCEFIKVTEDVQGGLLVWFCYRDTLWRSELGPKFLLQGATHETAEATVPFLLDFLRGWPRAGHNKMQGTQQSDTARS